jgi:hypothetical protein
MLADDIGGAGSDVGGGGVNSGIVVLCVHNTGPHRLKMGCTNTT